MLLLLEYKGHDQDFHLSTRKTDGHSWNLIGETKIQNKSRKKENYTQAYHCNGVVSK